MFIDNVGVTGCGIYVELLIPNLRGSCPTGSISPINTSLLFNKAELAHYSPGWNIAVAILILNGFVRDSLNDSEPFSIQFDNITVKGSRTQVLDKTVFASVGSAAILIAKFVGYFTISNSKILDSEVSGMSLFKSKVTFSGDTSFANNTGFNGGGLIICGASYLELSQTQQSDL